MKTQSMTIRLGALAGLLFTMAISFSEAGDAYTGYFDLRAALLVFVAPILVLVMFQRRGLGIGRLLERTRRMRAQDLGSLTSELSRNSAAARGQYGYSHVARLSEGHADPMVRYAGQLFSARFEAPEMARLLLQRAQAEDAEWQVLGSALGFLTKMAPYFGMLATVIGMIKLLQNMNDFTKISGSMALAMQGTLYGLLSFTLLYSPLQRYLASLREEALGRNERIARWFVLLAEQADPAYLEQELGAGEIGLRPGSAQAPVAERGMA